MWWTTWAYTSSPTWLSSSRRWHVLGNHQVQPRRAFPIAATCSSASVLLPAAAAAACRSRRPTSMVSTTRPSAESGNSSSKTLKGNRTRASQICLAGRGTRASGKSSSRQRAFGTDPRATTHGPVTVRWPGARLLGVAKKTSPNDAHCDYFAARYKGGFGMTLPPAASSGRMRLEMSYLYSSSCFSSPSRITSCGWPKKPAMSASVQRVAEGSSK